MPSYICPLSMYDRGFPISILRRRTHGLLPHEVSRSNMAEGLYAEHEMNKEDKEKIRGSDQWITNKYGDVASFNCQWVGFFG